MLKDGDKVIVVGSDDEEFEEWYDAQPSTVVEVSAVDVEGNLFWIKGEEGWGGAINMDCAIPTP